MLTKRFAHVAIVAFPGFPEYCLRGFRHWRMDNSIIQRGEFPDNWSTPSTFQTGVACELLRIPDASDDMLTSESVISRFFDVYCERQQLTTSDD